MSLLSEYETRTAWKYQPITGMFHTHQELTNKVTPDGDYKPFYGSTVVFIADPSSVQGLTHMQTVLHRECGDMLAAPLPVSSFHMTLHDLYSPETDMTECADEESYRRRVADSLSRAAEIVDGIRTAYAGKQIVMEADRVVNIMAKSLVLMLRPRSEQDYERLLAMYRQFDAIVSLPYPLTPHITLAYFRPGMIDGARLGETVARIQVQEDNRSLFVFQPASLTAQTFLDMQTYR